MSALPPKADIRVRRSDVCFVAEADILHCSKERRHSITSSARASSCGRTVIPNSFAVLRLMTSSSFVGCMTGKIGGLGPIEDLPSIDTGLPIHLA